MKIQYPRCAARGTAALVIALSVAMPSTGVHAHAHHSHGEPRPVTAATDAITSGEAPPAEARKTRAGGGEARVADVRPESLVAAARAAQANHDFDGALTLVDRAVRAQPVNDPAWLLAAAVHLVRGDTAAARQACNRLRQSPAIVTLTCLARVTTAEGDSARALRQLRAVLGAVSATQTAPGLLAWSYSAAGDAARDRDRAAAAEYYRRSLALRDVDQVRAALVDLLIEHGDLVGAAAALADGGDDLALAVRRMVVATRRGESERLAGDVATYEAQFRSWIAAGDWRHAREMTRFFVDVLPRPALARRLARINLSIQREPEDLRLAMRAGIHRAGTRRRADAPDKGLGPRVTPSLHWRSLARQGGLRHGSASVTVSPHDGVPAEFRNGFIGL